MAEINSINADFARLHPSAFAKVLGRGKQSEIMQVLEQLPTSLGASIVAKLPSSCSAVIDAFDKATVVRWLADAPYGDAISFLGRMPRERGLMMVNSLANRERRRKLLQFLKYPAHSVGTLVSDVLVRLSADTTVAEALRELRAVEAEDPGPIVVLEPDGRYLGVLDLWPLIARKTTTGLVRDSVLHVPALFPETSLVNAVRDLNWNFYNWLPVVDHEQRVLGGVSRDRVFGSTTTSATRATREKEMFASLATEMLRVLGALLDRVLGGRTAS